MNILIINGGDKMLYASEDLIKEHQGILFGLKILEKIVILFEKDNNINKKEIEVLINFFRLFADKCHHGKEEGLLFPAMEEVGIQNNNGPIGELLLEHHEGRIYISSMLESISNNFMNKNDFIQAANNYISLLRTHIEKENTILFPLGDRKIPQKKQKELLELFEEFEKKVMGKGTHEKLHQLLHDFENKYLA